MSFGLSCQASSDSNRSLFGERIFVSATPEMDTIDLLETITKFVAHGTFSSVVEPLKGPQFC
jgi:hypothetical protein